MIILFPILSAAAVVMHWTKYKNDMQNKSSGCQEPVYFLI